MFNLIFFCINQILRFLCMEVNKGNLFYIIRKFLYQINVDINLFLLWRRIIGAHKLSFLYTRYLQLYLLFYIKEPQIIFYIIEIDKSQNK